MLGMFVQIEVWRDGWIVLQFGLGHVVFAFVFFCVPYGCYRYSCFVNGMDCRAASNFLTMQDSWVQKPAFPPEFWKMRLIPTA
jgi:hypothetical protein